MLTCRYRESGKVALAAAQQGKCIRRYHGAAKSMLVTSQFPSNKKCQEPKNYRESLFQSIKTWKKQSCSYSYSQLTNCSSDAMFLLLKYGGAAAVPPRVELN